MFKGLTSELIANLNKDYDGGTYFEAIIVTLDPKTGEKDYFASYNGTVIFEGNQYDLVPMRFDSSFMMTERMELPSVRINILNIGRKVERYLHDQTVKIRKNDIIQQILHIDSHGKVTQYDYDRLQIQVVHSEGKGQATIFAGLNLRLTDPVPRDTLETTECPGIRGDAIRSGTT